MKEKCGIVERELTDTATFQTEERDFRLFLTLFSQNLTQFGLGEVVSTINFRAFFTLETTILTQP